MPPAPQVELALASDSVVLVLGTDGSKEHESMDRLDVQLPPVQSALAVRVLQALYARRAAGSLSATKGEPKVVLVLINYGEISTEELLPAAGRANAGHGGVDALLMAFMPHVGTPIAETLYGVFNPGGKLPYTGLSVPPPSKQAFFTSQYLQGV